MQYFFSLGFWLFGFYTHFPWPYFISSRKGWFIRL